MAKHKSGVRVMVRVSILRISNIPRMMPGNFQNLPEHRLKYTANACEGIRVNIPTGSETRVRGVQKKRFLDVTSVCCILRSPTPPTSMMAVGRGVLERAKKRSSMFCDAYSLLALSSLKRGCGGVKCTRYFFARAFFFAHTGIKTFFFIDFI